MVLRFYLYGGNNYVSYALVC